MFKNITRLPTDQIAPHLHNSCDQSVQNSIINSNVDFFKMVEEAMKTIEQFTDFTSINYVNQSLNQSKTSLLD